MMESLLEAIRVATNADATPEARVAGATACRTLLAAFDPTPKMQPNASAVQSNASAMQPHASMQLNASAVASAIRAIRGIAPEQLLDLAIAKLRAALPAGAQVAPVAPLKFHIIPISKAATP